MDFQLDKDWRLHPIDGDTGLAYMGTKASEKVFLKLNTTPFLAALSREGITPKLIWTKRTGSGDVLTAQEWLEGKLLTPKNVGNRLDVIHILTHLHHSASLREMLIKVGGKEIRAFDLLSHYAQNIPDELKTHQYLTRVFCYLEDHFPAYPVEKFCACHGDVNHKNWLLSDEGRLYLVDWDSAMIADPAVDLGVLLGRYVPVERWSSWLKAYGIQVTENLLQRVQWYGTMHQLIQIKKQYDRRDFPQMNKEILTLKKIFDY